MKKLIASLAIVASACAFAAPTDTSVLFSTVGPDKYADGTIVVDGECYALVWSADEFAGIQADCTCVNPADEILAIFPAAKDGKCKLSKYTLTAEAFNKGGNISLWLLDTRTYTSNADGSTTVSLATQESTTKVPVVNGAVAVEAAVEVAKAGFGGIAAKDSVTAGPVAIPAEAPAPNIKSIKVGDVYVELEVENTVPYITYGVSAGAKPDDLEKQSTAATGKTGEAITIYTPKTGDTGFFKIDRK